jgi:AraC-like DNA-binding protein
MKNSLFTDTRGREIPSFDLQLGEENVLFAFRTMEEIWDESGSEPDPPHRHNFYTIIFVKTGIGTHIIDYKEYDIIPGRVFFLSPGQVHQVYTPEKPDGLVIMFTKDFLCKYNISEDFLSNIALFSDHPEASPVDVGLEGSEKLEYIGKEIEQLFKRGERFVNDAVASWLKLFLIECNSAAEHLFAGNTQLLETGRSIAGEFKKLIEEKFHEWHLVGDYSKALNITPDYLNGVLKSTTGTNAKEYIQNRLILEARRLGAHTSLSSKEIAYKLGFLDPAHFSTFYKNTAGETFSDFRNKPENYNR